MPRHSSPVLRTSPAVAGDGSRRRPTTWGWWIVLTLALANLLIYVGTSEGSLSVFYPSLLQQFGWSRTAVASIGTIHLMVPGLAAFLVGVLCDRIGARPIVTAGAALAGVAFLLAAAAGGLPHFYAFAATVGLAECAVGFVPMQILVSHWFRERRGLAMGMATAGISLGGVMGPLLTLQLIQRAGWRSAFTVYAVGCLVVSLPATLLLIRNRPPQPATTDSGAAAPPDAELPGLSLGQALRTVTFWSLTLATSGVFYAVFAIAEHWVLFMQDRGNEAATAAALLTIYYLVGVAARFVWGPAYDRFESRWIAVGVTASMAAMAALLTGAGSLAATPYVFATGFGFCYGGFIFMNPLLLGEYFGIRSLGKIIGVSAMIISVVAAFGPTATGYLFHLTGSYRVPFGTAAAAAAVSALLLTTVRSELPTTGAGPEAPGPAAASPGQRR